MKGILAYKQRVKQQSLPEDYVAEILSAANKALEFQWPTLLASDYLRYSIDGNRMAFEKIYFSKRKNLALLVMGYIQSKETLFLPAIVDGLYSICEESTWIVPAHLDMAKDTSQDHIGTGEHNFIDLFSGETGALLAWTLFLLEDELTNYVPEVIARVNKELSVRIIKPYMECDTMWWMGIHKESLEGRILNNWNPWCNYNAIVTIVLSKEEMHVKEKTIERCIYSINQYLAVLPDDGGCDEGAGYWSHAAGNIYLIGAFLLQATEGQINIFDNKKIKKIGEFIYKVHIAEDYFIPFADCDIVNKHIGAPIIYGFGKVYNHSGMLNFAKMLFARGERGVFQNSWISLGRVFNEWAVVSELQQPYDEVEKEDVWLEQTQWVHIQRKNEKGRRVTLAVKGGHNDESHNHNDIGNYVVYVDGKPMIIDVGVGTYTKDTFSDKRYEIWTMQSQFHNLPSFAGIHQREGREYRCTQMTYMTDETVSKVQMDLTHAYEPSAGLKSYQRELSIDKESLAIRLEEHIELIDETSIEFHIMTARKPLVIGGQMVLEDDSRRFQIILPSQESSITFERIPIEDEKMYRWWGASIYRTRIQMNIQAGITDVRFIYSECTI